MKPVYKKTSVKFLLFFSLLITLTFTVNAQQQLLRRGNNNFTTFTPEKKYADISKLLAVTPEKYKNNPDFGKRLNDSANWYEEIGERTLKSRSFIGPNNEIITENGYDNINYIDANGWYRAVDTKLKPTANGWASENQELPVYINKDASTALSLGNGRQMVFNKNVEFNRQSLATDDYTVGDNGMYIKNAVTDADKIIKVGRGRIETDYKIKQPLKLNSNLVISEDILLPSGYTISENKQYNPDQDNPGCLVVTDPNGKVVANLKTPVCYDDGGKAVAGSYNFQKQDDGYKLEVIVPVSWLNDPQIKYPVTVDPAVTGPISIWTGSIINSCLKSFGDDTGSISVIIPAKVTITNCYVQACYYTTDNLPVDRGSMWFWTNCDDSIYSTVQGVDTFLPGYSYLASIDILPYVPGFLCCFKPSCDIQSFRLTMALIRTDSGSGCNANYLYYDPSNNDGYPFEAYVVGHTVEGSYLVQSPLCANVCTASLTVTTDYGVPPYTITHPWSTDTLKVGSFSTNATTGACTSAGTAKLTINIPNCPGAACSTTTTLSVPPPKIVDSCGDTVANLAAHMITIDPYPNVIATPDSPKVCSGIDVNMVLSSCITGSSFSWTGVDGSNGATDTINDSPNNNSSTNDTVNYTVTATGGGCTSNPTVVSAIVTPFTLSVNPKNPSYCNGDSVNLTASGDPTSYIWTPSTGLSATSGTAVTANPSVTTTYVIKGTSSGDCIAYDTTIVTVNPVPTVSVSPKDTTILYGQQVKLKAISFDSVTWSPSTGLSCSTCSNPIATPQVTTTYTATVTEGPCSYSVQVIINVIIPCASLKLPSAFTPDIPGKNQYLHVLNDGDVTLQVLRIYNRWGQKVFETNDIDGHWDGTFNGKAAPLGTYVYYAELTCQGSTVTVKGDVTLLR